MLLVDNNIVEHVPSLQAGGLFDAAVSVIETGLPLNEDYRSHNENAWFRIAAVKLGDGLALTFADITDHKRNEELFRLRAHHDALTELPNRAFFTERLQQAINRSQRGPDYKFAVLFPDFDRFKIINDSLGHEAGDELLIGIGKRLREQLDV